MEWTLYQDGPGGAKTILLAPSARSLALAEILSSSGEVLVAQCEERTDSAHPFASHTPDDVLETEKICQVLLERAPGIRRFIVVVGLDDSGEVARGICGFRQIFERDFFGPLAAVKTIVSKLRRVNEGDIIVVLPHSALVPDPQRPIESCAHGAIRRAVQSLRSELRSHHVNVHLAFIPPQMKGKSHRIAENGLKLKELSSVLLRLMRRRGDAGDAMRLRGRWHYLIEQLRPGCHLPIGSSSRSGGRRLRANREFHSAVITGASSGLGKELARLCAPTMEHLCIVGRDRVALEALQQELQGNTDCRVDVARVDLANLGQVEHFAETIDSADVLINCAGFSTVGAVKDMPIELYRRNMTVNFFAPVVLTEVLLRKHPPARRIVNILSTTAIAGRERQSCYSASKAALWAYTRILRQTLPTETEVLEVLPATFASNFSANIVSVGSSEAHGPHAVQRRQRCHGLTSEIVAAEVCRALDRGCRRLFVPHKAHLFYILETVAPALFRRMFP